MAQIGLQLYTVRDVADKQGYEATIRQVADAGYRNVETAGFPGSSPEKAAKLFAELGLKVVASHIGNPIGDAKNQILDTMEALSTSAGKPRIVVPWMDPKGWATEESVKAACDTLNQGAQNAQQHGFQLGYHNHSMEFGKTAEGQYVYQLMEKFLAPDVFFELDTYWVKVAGLDPAEVVKELGKRAPLLHIKDGPGNHEDPMTAVGEGVMDWPSLFKASGSNAEYWIVEMDQVAGDPLVEIRKSYQYLKNLKY